MVKKFLDDQFERRYDQAAEQMIWLGVAQVVEPLK